MFSVTALTCLYPGAAGLLFHTFQLPHACSIPVFSICHLLSLTMGASTWIHFFLLSAPSLLLQTVYRAFQVLLSTTSAMDKSVASLFVNISRPHPLTRLNMGYLLSLPRPTSVAGSLSPLRKLCLQRGSRKTGSRWGAFLISRIMQMLSMVCAPVMVFPSP